MTTVVNSSNSEVSTPTSYISRWIAQSHNAYQKKTNEFYSPSSSCDFRPATTSCRTLPTIFAPVKQPIIKHHTTTWQAQAKSRLDATNASNNASSFISPDNINNELQEKLHNLR
jgi:hypothetical protein